MEDYMNEKELKLASDFLCEHGNLIANDCCNDFTFPKDWSKEEIYDFVKEASSQEEFDPNYLHLPNFMVCWHLSKKLQEHNGNEE